MTYPQRAAALRRWAGEGAELVGVATHNAVAVVALAIPAGMRHQGSKLLAARHVGRADMARNPAAVTKTPAPTRHR